MIISVYKNLDKEKIKNTLHNRGVNPPLIIYKKEDKLNGRKQRITNWTIS